jgi:hypothetical protein
VRGWAGSGCAHGTPDSPEDPTSVAVEPFLWSLVPEPLQGKERQSLRRQWEGRRERRREFGGGEQHCEWGAFL